MSAQKELKWPEDIREVFAKLVEVLDDVLVHLDELGEAVERTLPILESALGDTVEDEKCLNVSDDESP